jgi:hypothetical protein
VVYLCHEECEETGSIFECSGGTYQKVCAPCRSTSIAPPTTAIRHRPETATAAACCSAATHPPLRGDWVQMIPVQSALLPCQVQLARAEGYVHDLTTGDPSVEDVRDNFEAIVDMDDAEVTDSGSMDGVGNVMEAAENGWDPKAKL